jgi:hypothetical protein
VPTIALTPADTTRAREIWQEYQSQHDVTPYMNQAVGIDPATGRVWFGESNLEIKLQQQKAGDQAPLVYLRVGAAYYGRKGRGR